MFTMYYADCVGNETNCLYPHKVEVKDEASFREAVSRDYVCAEYQNSYCLKLRSISLPSLTSCSTGLFFGCSLLESASLPKLQSMGNNTFYTCPAIRQIDLPSVKTIGSGQINGCTSLEVINIGPSITSINASAFQGAPEGLVVNLPVSEGVIANAPWGATNNIIINYDTPYAGSVPIPES